MKISLVSIPVTDPCEAHEIYTSKLGFESREFKPDESLAIVVSPEDKKGTAILLEPCKGNFAEAYQKSAYAANLPIMAFSVQAVEDELEKLKTAGIKLRPELDRPEWGIQNVFEDGCGNLIMIEEAAP